MTSSKAGQRMERDLKRVVGTSEDIHWEAVSTGDFTHPYNQSEPYRLEGDAYIIVGKESPELTDMDWDLAINDPSRLQRREAIPKEIVKLHVVLVRGNVDVRETKVLKRWKDERIIIGCMKHRFNGRELNKCLKEVD
jgi:hypothetical protein